MATRPAAQGLLPSPLLDGAYVRDAPGTLVFHALAPPTTDEVAKVALRTANARSLVRGTEGARFRLHVLTELKSRGLEDILFGCCNGLSAAGLCRRQVRIRRRVRVMRACRPTLRWAWHSPQNLGTLTIAAGRKLCLARSRRISSVTLKGTTTPLTPGLRGQPSKRIREALKDPLISLHPLNLLEDIRQVVPRMISFRNCRDVG